jgi:hypothetical protein
MSCVSGCLWLAAGSPRSGQRAPNDGWVAAYEPADQVFQRQCVRCHNSKTPAHGVDLSSYEKVMHGREAHGPLVAVGNPDASVMMQALRGRTAGKLDGASPHLRVVGPFDEDALRTIEDWMKHRRPDSASARRPRGVARAHQPSRDGHGLRVRQDDSGRAASARAGNRRAVLPVSHDGSEAG